MKKIPLAIIATIALLMLFLAIRGCQKNSRDLKATNEYLSLTEQKFREFKTESGLNAAKANQQILTLQALLTVKSREIVRLVGELKLKPKHITEYVEVVIEGKDSVILKRDTLYENYVSTPEEPTKPIPFSYKDKWNQFDAYLDGDQIGLSYSISDSLTLVKTKKGRKTTISALSANPAIKIVGLNSIEVSEDRTKRFGIGPTLTFGYADKVVFVPGIGVQWSLIRF